MGVDVQQRRRRQARTDTECEDHRKVSRRRVEATTTHNFSPGGIFRAGSEERSSERSDLLLRAYRSHPHPIRTSQGEQELVVLREEEEELEEGGERAKFVGVCLAAARSPA